MKKIMFLFLITACASSMNYGMDTEKNMLKKGVPETTITLINNKDSNEKLDIQNTKPLPNSIGMLSFFTNVLLGAGTELFKASKPVRATIFLLTNAALGAWYYKEYVTYELKKRDNRLKKDAVEWHPYSLGSHLIGGVFGGSLGTGTIMGFMQYSQHLAKQKLIEAEMALKKAQLDYKYSKN